MSTFERFLKGEVKATTQLQAIRNCDLLMRIPEEGKPTDRYDKVERVYFHKSTHKAFMSKFIGRGEWHIILQCYKVDIHIWTLNDVLITSFIRNYSLMVMSCNVSFLVTLLVNCAILCNPKYKKYCLTGMAKKSSDYTIMIAVVHWPIREILAKKFTLVIELWALCLPVARHGSLTFVGSKNPWDRPQRF